MANPASITDTPAVLVSGTGEDSVTLDAKRSYGVAHDKEGNTGTEDLNTIYLSFSASVDADESEGADKAKLLSGRSIDIGPGVSTLKFKTEAGAPTMTVVPGKPAWL